MRILSKDLENNRNFVNDSCKKNVMFTKESEKQYQFGQKSRKNANVLQLIAKNTNFEKESKKCEFVKELRN